MYFVFTKENCDYCDAAKHLLKSGNINYVECLLDTPEKIEKFKRETGENTVPQIWREDGKHIGNYEGLRNYIEVHLKAVVAKTFNSSNPL